MKEKDQDPVDQEELVFDEHFNWVPELIERLEQFEFREKIPSTPTTAPNSFEEVG